jgi:hypothetical protein
MEPCQENTIRYYHFPANDMLWVEESGLLKTLLSPANFVLRRQ